MPYIDIDDYEDVEIKFTESNIQSILHKIERHNDVSNKYSEEDIKKIKKVLYMLNDVPLSFDVEALLNSVYIDENTLEQHKGEYDEGYDDAMQIMEKERKNVYQVYGCLLQKLEHLAYGYGDQTPLTQDELKKIKEIIDDKA